MSLFSVPCTRYVISMSCMRGIPWFWVQSVSYIDRCFMNEWMTSIFLITSLSVKKLFHKYVCVWQVTIQLYKKILLSCPSIPCFTSLQLSRVLTVLVQVSALDNILLYSYVHNIPYVSIVRYHIGGTSSSLSYVSCLGHPGFNLSLKNGLPSLKISIVFFRLSVQMTGYYLKLRNEH